MKSHHDTLCKINEVKFYVIVFEVKLKFQNFIKFRLRINIIGKLIVFQIYQ